MLLGQYQLSEAPSFGRRDESLTASDIDRARSRAFEWCKEMLMGSDIHHSRRRVRQLLYWVKAFIQFPGLTTLFIFSKANQKVVIVLTHIDVHTHAYTSVGKIIH